jgi:hypothetical protein
LLAVEDEDGRVDIEDQSRRPVWPHCHAPQQAIVQLPQLGERRWRHAQQESPQRGRIRIGVESREVLEHAVLSQQLGRLDPFQSEDHWIEQREQHLADAVAMVALHQANLHGHRVLEPDPREEPMQKIDTTIVGQGLGPKCNRKISWPLRHCSECYPWGSIHCNRHNHSLTILGASLRLPFTNNCRRIQVNFLIPQGGRH